MAKVPPGAGDDLMAGLPAFPSVEEVDRILALLDPDLRNLRVTQGYHELSAALAAMLGAGSNWCTYAVWASKQAGQTIRREDLARLVELHLGEGPGLSLPALDEVAQTARRFGSRLGLEGIRAAVGRVVLDVLERTGAAVSRGNTLVFEEIGRELSRFLAIFAGDAALDRDKLDRFLAALRPGDPPDGQGFLRQAITHLYEASFLADPRARAERIHLANLEIGFHEQTRLQPELEDALAAALPEREELRRRLFEEIFPAAGLLLRIRLRLPRALRRMSPLDRALDRLLDELRVLIRRLATEILMRLELPGGEVLRLGRDLARTFPPALASFADADLLALAARIDPTPDSLTGSGAEDWADFAERMHYIADLFRCLAAHPPLFEPPFTPAQVADLKEGRRPSGRL